MIMQKIEMSLPSSFISLIRMVREDLYRYEPTHRGGLKFSALAKEFPFTKDRSRPRIKMADFAEFGFCSYKGWHNGKGTERRRPIKTVQALERGLGIHEDILLKDIKKMEKAPKATDSDLRDPTVDLLGIPEFPSRIKMHPLIYLSKIERASRMGGNIVVSEIKTSQHEMRPDHLLQVWGYCLSAPGGIRKVFGNNYSANIIEWQLIYHDADSDEPRTIIGPYAFDWEAFDILENAMKCYAKLYQGGSSNNLPGPSTARCAGCGYFWRCKWKIFNMDEYEDIETEIRFNKSNLRVLQQVGISRFVAMEKAGIKTIDDISEKNRDILKKLPGSSNWHVNKWIQQVKAIKKNQIIIIDDEKKKRLMTDDLICYDIETDDLGNHIWIIGAYDLSTKNFYQFFAKRDEKKILREFDSLLKHRKPKMLISYSNCHYERRIVTKIAKRFDMNDLIDQMNREIDLGIQMPDILIGNFNIYKLKDLGSRLGFQFRHPEIDGLIVGMSYSDYLRTGREMDWALYKEYNEDDVMALIHIIQYIQNSKALGY